MTDATVNDRFLIALGNLGLIADELTVEEALDVIESGTLEVFWRDWPQLKDWMEALWQRLNDDLAGPATPAVEADLDETGDGD